MPRARLILLKRQYYGFSGEINNWFSNWLAGRKDKLVVDGEPSEEGIVESGVHQGTVLGLLH